jgi:hypothetical protein
MPLVSYASLTSYRVVTANRVRPLKVLHLSMARTLYQRVDGINPSWAVSYTAPSPKVNQELGGIRGMVRVFRQKVTLVDAIGSHACSLEASSQYPLKAKLALVRLTVHDFRAATKSTCWVRVPCRIALRPLQISRGADERRPCK